MPSTAVSPPMVSNYTVPTISIPDPSVSTPTVSTTISGPSIPNVSTDTTTIAARAGHTASTASSTLLASLEKMSLVKFRLNKQGYPFSSFEEIFQQIDHHQQQQRQEDRLAMNQSLLRFKTGVIQKFEQFDSKLLKYIEEEKAWEFVDLDQNTLIVQLAPPPPPSQQRAVKKKSATDNKVEESNRGVIIADRKKMSWPVQVQVQRGLNKSAKREASRELGNRGKILSSWGPEVATLFENSARFELGQVVKVVKKYPAYKDARDRINNSIIERLTDKNSTPTPQKVFTRTGDWIKVGEKNVSADPIPYKVLKQLNIRLGPHDVLESGPPPPPPPLTVTNPPKQITGPETSPSKLTSPVLEKENQNSRAPDSSVPPLLPSLTLRNRENPKGEKRKKGSHEDDSEESSSCDDLFSNKDEPTLKKPKVEEGRPGNGNRGGDGEESEDETSTDKYKRTCWCEEKIPVSVLEDLEQKGDITMVEAIYTWGLMWQRLGWDFCPQHLSRIADHLNLAEVTEVERLDRVKAIWENRDPQALYRLVVKNVDWFESTEKVWLYGDK